MIRFKCDCCGCEEDITQRAREWIEDGYELTCPRCKVEEINANAEAGRLAADFREQKFREILSARRNARKAVQP